MPDKLRDGGPLSHGATFSFELSVGPFEPAREAQNEETKAAYRRLVLFAEGIIGGEDLKGESSHVED